MPICPACGAQIEWIRDGSMMVPVDPGTREAVMPGRGQFAVYGEDGRPIVGRRVRAHDRGRPGVRWGRTLHWTHCACTGSWDKAAAEAPRGRRAG